MRNFSKSKLLALRQCPKRLWLEIHGPDLREDSSSTQMNFQVGHQVGDMARKIYDPQRLGALIDVQSEGFESAFARTKALLGPLHPNSPHPVFEAGFSAAGVLAFADVMLPVAVDGQSAWRMVEVKSSASVKGYHHDDAAIQAFVARAAGVPLQSIALAHVDTGWVYDGDGDYAGLLVEVDLTDEAFSRTQEVKDWITQAQNVAAMPTEPSIDAGEQCEEPFACGFMEHCCGEQAQAEYPINWLPNLCRSKRERLAAMGASELNDVPDDMLSERQQRVKTHTLANTAYFDADGAAQALAEHVLPAYFLDFESTQFAVPIWKGDRPYQPNVFQFSLHSLSATSHLSHAAFLDLSGKDPAESLAAALILHCGDHGPVFAYNAGFERGRIASLADRFAYKSAELWAIHARMVDLMPIAKKHYYHPSQQGSWSLKRVLPAVVPELSYDALDGVADGGMAMEVYHEAIHTDTSAERKAQIEQELLVYCKLDTYALVRLWQVFAGRTDLKL
jgi:hypothetical protein